MKLGTQFPVNGSHDDVRPMLFLSSGEGYGVCLSVYDYSRTTGNEAASER